MDSISNFLIHFLTNEGFSKYSYELFKFKFIKNIFDLKPIGSGDPDPFHYGTLLGKIERTIVTYTLRSMTHCVKGEEVVLAYLELVSALKFTRHSTLKPTAHPCSLADADPYH